MDIFDILTMIGGLCLFLFGMDVMGQALERRAGGALRTLLSKLTTNKLAGLLTGLCVTAVIQSSSATTVMVVGFVNSSLMTLKQAINVIMGANIGTTVTAWILSLGGIDGDNLVIQLLKPTSFTPVLALIGIIMTMFGKDSRKKDTGVILLGFATLMFGMDTMSDAVAGLADVPQFRQLFLLFKNPILGVLAGAVLTAIIQSSSASVGILQALAATGQVSLGAAIPIIMGQNIGTCITAILSSFGANKNAKRAALVHLSFNVIGTVLFLVLFCIVKAAFAPAILDNAANYVSIAISHSVFNVFCTLVLFPMGGILEKLVIRLVPDAKETEAVVKLDERLLATPSLALESCHNLAVDMVDAASVAIRGGIKALREYSPELAEEVCASEEKTDHYEDILGTYLVKLSSHQISDEDNAEAAKLLRMIGDFERISDHGVNILKSVEEMREKNIVFTEAAQAELDVILDATDEILALARRAFVVNDIDAAVSIEPLEQVIDMLREQLRARHIVRLQQGECTIDAGFVWSDLLTNLARTSDHCSNIAGCVIDVMDGNMNLHESIRAFRDENPEFKTKFREYTKKYTLA
ncbi:MAG: Na/Pi cotransporter family protein [Oscillospiraceae bacterium]|nr:Na/Pi cotransporter family protein [Oscillospiraceae bacterium]